MFAGVASLKIFGGNFRQINGSYTQHEYNTHVMNYNSNNMIGNTLNETYNDNSQEYHGVNAKGRAYVRALRQEASAQNQIDGTTQPGEPPHSEESQASEPTPASPDAAFQQHVPVQPSPTTFTQAVHSSVSSMSCSVAVGDIKKMPSRAADHFLRAFELMDEEDDGEDTQREDSGVAPNLLGVSRQKPVHIGEGEDNNHTASYAVRPDNAQQFNSSGHPAVLPPPSPQPPTSLHQFSSQKLNPSSSYSHTAHNMRNVITDSITRTSDDAGHSSQSTSTVTLSDGANASHMAVPNAAAVPFSNSANTPFAISQTIINESYTEINYNTHTVNHPSSGIVSNNMIQTHHNLLSEGTREKRKRDVEDDVLPKMEEQRRRKRQSKKRTQRPPRRV